jgi:hypothetical protein
MRRRVWERLFFSFEAHGRLIERPQDGAPGRLYSSDAEQRLLFEETKTGCLTGMLLCLRRRERMALILGTFFDAGSELGGQLMGTTPDNYRQILSRARKRLANFMNERCGLMNESNPCRCSKKIPGAIQAGLVDPQKPRFNLPYIQTVREFVADKAPLLDTAVEMRLQNLLREQPMYKSPDFRRANALMLKRGDVGQIIDFR